MNLSSRSFWYREVVSTRHSLLIRWILSLYYSCFHLDFICLHRNIDQPLLIINQPQLHQLLVVLLYIVILRYLQLRQLHYRLLNLIPLWVIKQSLLVNRLHTFIQIVIILHNHQILVIMHSKLSLQKLNISRDFISFRDFVHRGRMMFLVGLWDMFGERAVAWEEGNAEFERTAVPEGCFGGRRARGGFEEAKFSAHTKVGYYQIDQPSQNNFSCQIQI